MQAIASAARCYRQNARAPQQRRQDGGQTEDTASNDAVDRQGRQAPASNCPNEPFLGGALPARFHYREFVSQSKGQWQPLRIVL